MWEAILFSGMYASIVSMLLTRAIEYFGGVAGGILGGMPSTIIAASVGLTYILGDDEVLIAMYITPIGMFINCLYLYMWRILPNHLNASYSSKRRLLLTLIISLSVWLLGATSLYFYNVYVTQSYINRARISGILFYALHLVTGVYACFNHVDAPKGTQTVSLKLLIIRGFAGFVIMSTAMYFGSVNAVLGSIFSTFPVIYTTTMVSVWLAQGTQVSLGT